MDTINVIVLCPDCNEGFHLDEMVEVERRVVGHSWKAIQRVCKNCAEKNRDKTLILD